MLRKLKKKTKEVLKLNKNANSRYVKRIMDATGWSKKKTLTALKSAKKRLGVDEKNYCNWKLFELSEDQQKKEYARRIRNRSKKEDNIKKIMLKTGWEHDYAKKQVDLARRDYGIRSRLYEKYNFHETIEKDNNTKKSAKNRVLILARNYTNAIGVIRALGEAGYEVDLIASANRVGKSKYISESKFLDSCIEVVSSKTVSEEDILILKEIIKYSNSYSDKVFLMPTDDYTTAIIDKYKTGLKKHFIMPYIAGENNKELIQLMNKFKQVELADKAGLLTPKSCVISLRENINIPSDISYPCYCKPTSSIYGYKTEMAKCVNRSELETHLKKMKEKDSEREFLVQEFLVIDEELDVSGICLGDKVFMPAVIKAGKIANFDKGVMITGELLPISEIDSIVENIKEMLKELHYYGIFSVQLCKANGQFYFIELNLRTVGYNYVYYASGVNLPALLIRAIKEEKYSFDNEKINEFGKSFVYEQVAWDDYIRGNISKEELDAYIDNADVKLLYSESDPRPGEIFQKQYARQLERRLENKQKGIDEAAQIKRFILAQEGAKEKLPGTFTIEFDKDEFEKKAEQFKYDAEKNKIDKIDSKKQPKPIIAASYLLGCPLPVNAVLAYQPSVYLPETEGTLNDIREKIGKEFFPNTLSLRKEFKKFKKKFIDSNFAYSNTDLEVFFVDYMLYCKDYGFNIDDYFDYEFCNKEIEVRETFLNNGYRKYVRQLCNKKIQLFANKANFNNFFKPFVKRKYCDSSTADFNTFKDFVAGFDKLFAKPVKGTGGAGACVLDIDHNADMKELYEYCKSNEYILEEIVTQHKDLAKFNKDTLNTMRVYSLVDINNETRIMGAFVKFGIVGQVVDNFHSGGFVAEIDVDTGEIYTKGINRKGEFYSKHPDSKLEFKGAMIPEWEKVKEAVSEGARSCAHLNRHCGWDVAVTADGNIEFIEGNSRPNFDAIQKVDMIGKFDRYEKYMPALAKAENRPEFKNVHIDIDIDNMESPRIQWK